MGDLEQIRKKFVAAAVTLALIVGALLVYLLWPKAQQAREADLRQQLTALNREVALWQKSDPATTRQDLKRLYADNVPSHASQISQHLEKLVQETGVTSPSIRYSPDTTEKTSLPGVQQVKIETAVTGDYSKVARFINAVEQDKLLFLIDKISLSSQQEKGIVSLQITFNAFVREGAEAGAKART
jgi:Type II secretion system (T2SS), protein M subtype b